jgi:hypothetical protein
MLNRLPDPTPSSEVKALAREVCRLRPDWCDPEAFYEQRSEIAGALMRLSQRLADRSMPAPMGCGLVKHRPRVQLPGSEATDRGLFVLVETYRRLRHSLVVFVPGFPVDAEEAKKFPPIFGTGFVVSGRAIKVIVCAVRHSAGWHDLLFWKGRTGPSP